MYMYMYMYMYIYIIYIYTYMQVILQWYWECPHPCPYRSIGATFVKILKLFRVVQKVSGRVQEGPWSSPDPIKKMSKFWIT